MNKKNLYTLMKFFLLIFAFVSLFKGIYNAYIGSIDFHYSPAVMAWSGKNHYEFMLNGGALMLSQNGEYGQGIYILLYPFTLMSWPQAKVVWMLINIFLAFFLPIFFSRKFNLNKEMTFLVILLFIAGTPSRNVIGNGQLSLVMMTFLIIPFFYNKFFQIVLSGIVYLKYNMGYALFLYFISKKEIKNLIYSSIIFILGWLIYCYVTDTNLIVNFFQPLKLTLFLKTTSELIYGLSFLKYLFSGNSYIDYIVLSSSILMSLIFLIMIKNISSIGVKISLFCLIILIFSPHRIYDYILLLPLLTLSIHNFEKHYIYKMNTFFVCYLFFGLRLIKEFGVDIDIEPGTNTFVSILINSSNIFLFLFLFIINYSFQKKINIQ